MIAKPTPLKTFAGSTRQCPAMHSAPIQRAHHRCPSCLSSTQLVCQSLAFHSCRTCLAMRPYIPLDVPSFGLEGFATCPGAMCPCPSSAFPYVTYGFLVDAMRLCDLCCDSRRAPHVENGEDFFPLSNLFCSFWNWMLRRNHFAHQQSVKYSWKVVPVTIITHAVRCGLGKSDMAGAT